MKNKVIVITGASSGIGRATALLLAAQGANIVAGARRKQNLESLVNEISTSGGSATYQVTDVTQQTEVTGLIQHALSTYGQIDVIINNAGVMPLSKLDQLKVEEWERMINVNIKGVLYGIAAALPVMLAQGFGHIINTASLSAHSADPYAVVYSATKYAVRAISEGLRKELDGKLKVTLISPGVTATELGHDITDEISALGLKELRKHSISPETIARSIAYAIEQEPNVDVSEIIIRQTGGM